MVLDRTERLLLSRRYHFTRSFITGLLSSLPLVLVSCGGEPLSHREVGGVAGGTLGAVLGGVVGNQLGESELGVGIGSVTGIVAGGLVGNSIDVTEQGIENRNERLRSNAEAMQRNQRLIEDLRARGSDVFETPRGTVVNIPDVLFEVDSYQITPSADYIISDIVRLARERQPRIIAVEGHTDSTGSFEHNEELSLQRAESVASALVQRGITPRQIQTQGYGELRPIASNMTERGRQRNRRVEVVLER